MEKPNFVTTLFTSIDDLKNHIDNRNNMKMKNIITIKRKGKT